MIAVSEVARDQNLDILVLIADPNDRIPELTPSFRGLVLIHG